MRPHSNKQIVIIVLNLLDNLISKLLQGVNLANATSMRTLRKESAIKQAECVTVRTTQKEISVRNANQASLGIHWRVASAIIIVDLGS